MTRPDLLADLPGRIPMRPGGSVAFPLPSAMGGGYTWSVAVQSGDAGEAAIEVEPPPPPDPSMPAATTARERLVVTARQPGSLALRLRLARSWEPDAPLVDRVVEVVVGPPEAPGGAAP